MLLTALLLCQVLRVLVVHAGYEVESITCVCSTTHCLEHGMISCNTTGMCFSQYLDRRDGSHPLVRGCITSKTPLLCENRRPAIARGTWPVLLCCNSNLCNRDVIPTPPAWFLLQGKQRGQDATDEHDESSSVDVKDKKNPSASAKLSPSSAESAAGSNFGVAAQANSKGDDDDMGSALETEGEKQETATRSGFPKIVSPVYITVLVLGIISLVIIGVVAAVVLRRNNKFYAEQYGVLERHEEYFKQPLDTSHAENGDCDSIDTLPPCQHHQLPTFALCSYEEKSRLTRS